MRIAGNLRRKPEIESARPHAVSRDLPQYLEGQSQTLSSRLRADGGSIVFLQCRIFHLRSGGREVLPRQCKTSAASPAAVRVGQFFWAADTGAAVRFGGPKADDYGDIWDCR